METKPGDPVHPTEKEREPWGVHWLDSAYQQTLLPNGPWHQMEDKVSKVLAQRVEKHFLKAERKEALLQLLGEDFNSKYLPNAKHNPWCLEPPAMSQEEKNKLMREAQATLNSQMYKAVKDVGYQNMLNKSTPPSSDLTMFLQHTFSVYKTGLERELYRQEQELTKQKKQKMNIQKKFERQQKIPAPSRLKPVGSGSSSSTSGSTPQTAVGAMRDIMPKMGYDPPPLWGPQSDHIGRSVLALLQKDPRKFDHVAQRLHGRQLPGTLRSYIWSDVLFKRERERLKEVVVEKVVRERFAKALSRGIQGLKINRATSSPINGLIENAVIETYNKTTSLVPFKSAEHMKEAIRTLNVIYVYDRSYEPYLIHWLFPLQIAFQVPSNKERDDRGESVIEMAMYLDLLNSNCFPTWPAVFSIAEGVLNTVRQADPDLYNHLKMISRINVKVNPKEFLVQLLHEEKSKAEALLKSTPGGVREQEMSAQLLADPLVFIRRWIGEGFVSILDTPSVMYVWDQCFLQHWSHKVIQNFCLALLQLLRHKFMVARNYNDMKNVFFNEACKLYTADLQAAWIHLEQGRDPSDIPFLNRQRPETPASRMSRLSLDTGGEGGLLASCGIKDVKLKLVIPSEVMQRESWLAHVDPNCLKLNAVAYFGEVRLQSHNSIMPAGVLSATQDSYGNTIYEIVYPEDKFLFKDLDITPYDLEREMGAYPYAIIRVDYKPVEPGTKGKPPLPVGWARIPLFQKQAGYGGASAPYDTKWDLQAGDQSYDLHAGEIPESLITTLPVSPSETGQPEEGTILGYNSKLFGVVYDAKNEPPGKFVPSLPQQVAPTDTREPSPAPPSRQPTPRQPTPRQPTPRQPTPQQLTPVPRRTPVHDYSEWVAPNPAVMKKNPPATGLKDTFDLYIDSVRFIPDYASFIKVTGRVLRPGALGNVDDVLALPDLNSAARCPTFNSRVTLNAQRKEADPGMLIFLRVYTVDVVGDQLGVIGNCLVPFFDKKKLRVGGFQYRLHNGMPELKGSAGLSGIKFTDLDNEPEVPACTLLLRILPHTQDPVQYPQYSSGYFESTACKPNTSEMRMFQSFKEHMAYPQTVREMIQRIMESEGLEPHGKTDTDLTEWMESRLDIRRQLTPGRPAGALPLTRVCRYKLKNGLNVKVNQVFGLPEGMYVQCFVRVAPGLKVLSMDATAEGYGGEEKFVTLKHNFGSFQQAQEWVDAETNLHPFYDQNSCLVIQLFGLEVMYTPRQDHAQPGTVTDTKGNELTLEDESRIIGWTVMPLFEGKTVRTLSGIFGNSVLTGIHHVPVFKGKPSGDLLQQLVSQPIEQVLENHTWNNRNKFPAASLQVTLWDAHFDFDHVPELPVYEYLLESVGRLLEYQRVRRPPANSKKMMNFILDTLDTRDQKKAAIVNKEKGFFQDLMEKTFYDLMESALMTAGYGPL